MFGLRLRGLRRPDAVQISFMEPGDRKYRFALSLTRALAAARSIIRAKPAVSVKLNSLAIPAGPFVLRPRLRYSLAMLATRLADPADHAAIVALVYEAFAVYVPRIGRPPAPMLEDYGALIRKGRVHLLEDETGIVVLIPEERAM